MIRTIIQRQTRIAAPLRISMIRNRFYATDKFQERETASENKYIHDKEMAKIKALRDQLDKAQKQLDELEAKAKESKKDVASKDKK
ncbi:hypothetical protein GGI26_003373 [Coemansia sp. RSA 1358]|nr:hypothetical protein BX070DRAFT_225086 [Coemansia spiralis]KAJ1989398.1 hypothetical protein EDC05_004727 [Coemansia umbellata]KAJ2622362.1 hypothetical protein GGI26_003373 [Coemansia sp. RSA 1358]